MSDQPLILIIDDEPEFLEIFGTRLLSSGFRVETARSGEEGIEKAKALKPDLILLDVKMPTIDGAETLMRFRDDPQTKDFKIAFLTNLGDPWEEAQALNAKIAKESGALGYLKKTENLDVLENKVKALLGNKLKQQ